MSSQKTSIDSSVTAPAGLVGGRAELLLVAGIVLLGLVLRGLRWEEMAVEHFDEGVYASNLCCGHLDPPFAYPMRHLYAPPLFPAILEWAQILAGPGAVMWVNVLLGSLTVLAVWWATRCWFGRTAAIAAATLAATSEYHIAFSRMALTDVPLSLFMLIGVFAGWRAILSGRPMWILTAGVTTGLAWCTKYNGWLTLAVTGSGTAAFLLAPKLMGATAGSSSSGGRAVRKAIDARSEISVLTAFVRWGLTAAIAGTIFWVFVLRDLAPLGGYAAVAKNHAGYFVGLGGWWSGFVRQAGAHQFLQGPATIIGLGAACLIASWLDRCIAFLMIRVGPRQGGAWIEFQPAVSPLPAAGERTRRRFLRLGRGMSPFLVAPGFMLLGWLGSVSGVLGLAALGGVICAISQGRQSTAVARADELKHGSHLAAWLLCAWFFGLLIAVPLYYPYPRLSLPWLVACWPLAGAAVTWLVKLVETTTDTSMAEADQLEAQKVSRWQISPAEQEQRRIFAAAIASVLAILFLPSARGLDTSAGYITWENRFRYATSLRSAAFDALEMVLREVSADTRSSPGGEADAVVYVQGDPAVFYHVSRLSPQYDHVRLIVVPVAEPNVTAVAGVPTFLVTRAGPETLSGSAADYRLVTEERFGVSDMVLLDELPASALRDTEKRSSEALRLYEVP